MKTVEFHHGVPDKMAYSCRLLRKAYRSGAKVVVTADATTLRQLDRQLWVFDEQEFLPHVCALAGQPWPAHWADTPIWLTDAPDTAPSGRQVLINVGDVVPPSLDAYARFLDVVSSEPEDRQRGRQRWRQYQSWGWTVQSHPVQE